MSRVLVGLVVVGLLIFALTDLLGSDEEDRAGLPRWLWIVIVVLLPIFGPVAWIVTKQTRRRGGYGGRTGRPGRGPRRGGPVAPDDDPDFLWRLEQEKRRRQRGEGGDHGEQADGGRDDGEPGDGGRGGVS